MSVEPGILCPILPNGVDEPFRYEDRYCAYRLIYNEWYKEGGDSNASS